MFRRILTKYAAAKKVMYLYSDETFSTEYDVTDTKKQGEGFDQDVIDMLEGLENVQKLEDDVEILSWLNEYQQPKKSTSLSYLNRISVRNKKIAAAAVLLLGFGLIFDWLTCESNPQRSDWIGYTTRVGEQKTINLEDGSLVTLNTGTELLVNINSQSRDLILKRGQAHFDVAKDAKRPFIVEVGERSVTALGTVFDILKTPEKITVTVLEGVVALHENDLDVMIDLPSLTIPEGENLVFNSPEHKRVEAGKVAEFYLSNQALKSYQHPNIEKTQEWRTGKLRFEQVALKDVVLQLNRYSRKKIIIQDTSIMDLKLYAVIRVDRIDLALDSIEEALPIKVVRYFDHILLVAKNK